MKINPVAIQSYQQAIRREDTAGSQKSDDTQVADAGKRLQIEPQNEGAESRLAVRVSAGNYADSLTPEEKSALDLLFTRFRDSERFGPGYTTGTASQTEDSLLGGMIDVKV